MRPKVFATRRIPSPGIELLSEGCDVTVYEGTFAIDRAELLKSVGDMDGLVCIPQDRIDREVLDAAPFLKAISTYSVGYEHIDLAEATKRGIYVGHTPGILTDATADLAFALLLAAARRIAEADRYVREGKWQAPFGSSPAGPSSCNTCALDARGASRSVRTRSSDSRMAVRCPRFRRERSSSRPAAS